MKWKFFLKIVTSLLFLFFLSIVIADETVNLLRYKLIPEENKVILLFTFDKLVKYHCSILNNPNRLVLDLDNTINKAHLITTENTLINGLRSNDHEHHYLRIVFDLKHKVKYSAVFTNGNELKISLTKTDAEDATKKTFFANDINLEEVEDKINTATSENTPTHLSANLPLVPEPKIALTKSTKTKNIVIVIDPGHGGKDPGAAGLRGTKEKDIVLKISKQLQGLLNDEPGFCAVLTRTTDCYIPLRKRLAIARRNHADLFIAIHADAYHHCHATGASVYALSQRGATSEAARWLAEKENESELGGLSTELADKDAILRSVLIDLSQTHTIESSLQIGSTLLHNMGQFAKLHHPRVEQAAFVVLKSPDIPSVLVETGFLSNPIEEDKLINPDYQRQTAYAIKEGIKQYFTINSPDENWYTAHATSHDLTSENKKSTIKNKHHRKNGK